MDWIVLKALLLAALITLVMPVCARQPAPDDSTHHTGGRTRPPVAVQCDRNQLTSFSGSVTDYQRGSGFTQLVIRTDWDTDETVVLQGDNPASFFLIFGQAFNAEDWQKIESAPGLLIKDMRATAWVCSDGENPTVVDWRPGETGEYSS